MAIVRSATRMTGASDVMTEAAFGCALRKLCRGLMNPAILVKLVKAQSNDTGKIYAAQAQDRVAELVTHPNKCKDPNTKENHPSSDKLRAVDAFPKPRPEEVGPVGCRRCVTG